ncbi:bifunctional serine/threonine-protein kinase/formylglycine-generating enzyme family protein [Calycomorphotria hydatis]|uniref:non-specific serine/threonine protein kinase n=1 Tax=Calycomorphotria hydatis TaxID=2528027 RepID=A0A517TBZ3_9PLAN|nr:bifunctional serine/threonine-protein kinase/formylglycine-generating enzyme family protein [Calycomorphotria hydatis]QDT65879.1 Serine/threonine-protein kinase PrkC [Calycomorphotria hydatis]
MTIDSTIDEEFVLKPTSIEEVVDRVCHRFLNSWQKGEKPRIEDFVVETRGFDQTTLLNRLILLDVKERIKLGEHPELSEYASRFPSSVEVINRLSPLFQDSGSDILAINDATAILDVCAVGRLGRYDISSRLGTGSFGAVWRAWDRKLKRNVALKVIDRARLSKHEVDLALHEAGAAAQLSHPNIVSVYDVGEADGAFFIVAEYVEGADLKTHLAQGKLNPERAVKMVCQLAQALQHAHEQGVIHRDVKPSNVLVDYQGNARLTDFGIARWDKADKTITDKNQIVGSPAYMAPEQARGRGLGPYSDVYSLGIVLYELLTGQRPFEGSLKEIMFNLQFRDPPNPRTLAKGIPRDLETIVLKAVSKRPADRYQSAKAFAVDLERWSNGLPVKARRITPMGKVWRYILRQPIVSASVGLALVISLGGAAAFSGLIPVQAEKPLPYVEIDTVPSDAEIRFVPFDTFQGRLIPEDMITPDTRTPVRVQLKHGDYFVVAAKSPTTFHEVFRHVPHPDEEIPIAFRHLMWRRNSDGLVKLPTIQLFKNEETTPNMILIKSRERDEGFTIGNASYAEARPVHRRYREDYYIDKKEVTVGEYWNFENNDRYSWVASLFGSGKDIKYPLADAIPVSYHHAISYLEAHGKRLPDEFEFEFAATIGVENGQKPIGFQEIDLPEFGPAGTPKFDVTVPDKNRPNEIVFGLHSNLAEWTMSAPRTYPSQLGDGQMVTGVDCRVVRGGFIEIAVEGKATTKWEQRAPARRFSPHMGDHRRSIGFRGVRSSKARLKFEDFKLLEEYRLIGEQD